MGGSAYVGERGEHQPTFEMKFLIINFPKIQRHGARFPTLSSGTAIEKALSKLQSVSAFKDTRLHFLNNYSYELGYDDLIPFGAAQ